MNQVAEIKTAQQVATERSNVTSYGDNLLAVIERAARDPSVDVDKFERLMAMRERLDAEAARKAFNAAIAAAKGEIQPVTRNATGHNQKKYADFSAIAAAIDPIISKHGLSYRFRTSQSDRINVTCILSHTAGHYEETTLSGPADASGNKNAIQAIGSSLTYLQRYSLTQALGLASTNDDDGKKAEEKDLSALIEEGTARAQAGMNALQSWWQASLSNDERKAIGKDKLAELKAIAQGDK